MQPFSGDEDRIIHRMVRENREDCNIAIVLSLQGVRRTAKQVYQRRAELGLKRFWSATHSTKERNTPTLEEIEDRKRQVQATWSQREQMRRRGVTDEAAYEFPVYRISVMEA
jgi:hypothetical protein